MTSSAVELAQGVCAAHPAKAAVALCDRCGDYHCADCNKRVAGRSLCARCRELPGVDYLEDTRRRYWGKRDGFIWYFGLFVPLMTLVALPSLWSTSDVTHLASGALWLAISVAYLARYRPARLGLVVLSGLELVADFVRLGLGLDLVPGKPGMQPLPLVFGSGLVIVLITLAAYRSPRNQLAFEIPVDDEALQRVYDRYLSNPLAVRSAVYGALFCAIPFASLFSLLMGVRALRRADPAAWPPRSGRLPAQIGICLSLLGIAFWSSLAALAILR